MAVAIGGEQLRGSPLISQGDLPFVGVYPHTSPHRRIGFTARRPAGNRMMPDRCQIASEEGPPVSFNQKHTRPVERGCAGARVSKKPGSSTRCTGFLMGFARRSHACDRVTEGRVWQKCGKEASGGCRNAGGKKDPPGVFHLHERGAGWSRTRTRTQTIPEISGWRTRPNFLAKFFRKKFWK